MRTSTSLRWLVVVVSAAMLLAVAAACGTERVEVPGETVVVEKEVIKEVQVPGETVVVEKEVVKTVEVPGETVTKEVVKEVQVPGETVVVEKEVVKTVEVPGETVVVEKVVVKEVEAERYVRDVRGELGERPQYGGTFHVPMYWLRETFDPYDGGPFVWDRLVLEKMANFDWAYDLDLGVPLMNDITIDYITEQLAESWEVSPDLKSYTFHIRQGVPWHDKAPVNGRDVNAYDAEFTWHRNLGLGSGYTEPSPHHYQFVEVAADSVTATDEYTLVVETSTPKLATLAILLGVEDWRGSVILPQEPIEEYGDLTDWRHVVGSGPYELTDVVEGSSVTLTKNPNYWRDDPRLPDLKNRLPYADEITLLVIPEVTSVVAALRTGKVVWLPAGQVSPEQVRSLMRTNPELVAIKETGSAHADTYAFRLDRPPFNDKNVRIAMQKAINLDEINYAYYEGDADTTPVGYVWPTVKEMFAPYSEWPEDVKWQYKYDPEEAERLLDEAGYPRGANGIRFEAGWDLFEGWGHDLDLAQIIKSYWDKIGVDVTLSPQPDGTVMWNRVVAGEHGGLTFGGSRPASRDPSTEWDLRFGFAGGEMSGIVDAGMTAIYAQIDENLDREVAKKLSREIDMYYSKELWALHLPVVSSHMLHQAWLKGYKGELGVGVEDSVLPLMYLWIDQELKNDMGH